MTQKPTNFPDFFIIGAQKAGTTSLCAALDGLTSIALSRPKEPMLLSRDELELHPHFFAEQPQAWDACDWEHHPDAMLAGYAACFAHAQPGVLLGDGSTSYLNALQVPKRIASTNSNAKIIVLLRDPAKRAYSAYWHYVKTGTACESFANHLRFENGMTIRSGHYVEHITRWLTHIPRAQCHFILYEQMLRDPVATLHDLCHFLGITPPATVSLPAENQARTPRLLSLQLAINYLYRRLGRSTSAIANPSRIAAAGETQSLLDRALYPLLEWNLREGPYPPMAKALHRRLDIYYARVNAGLVDLTGLDVSSHWYSTIGK